MRLIFTLSFLLSLSIVSAQSHKKNNKIIRVEYNYYSNGQKADGGGFGFVYSDDITYLSKVDDKIRSFIDYKNRQNVTIMEHESNLYKTISSFDSLSKATFADKTEKIMGYNCKYAFFSYFSNKIEVWFTEEILAKGSPYKNYLPNDKSLVLKIVVNGGKALVADSIYEIESQEDIVYPFDEAKQISDAEFEEMKILSRYEKMMVFENETINFDPSIRKPNSSDSLFDSTYRFSKGTIIMKRIKMPEIYKKGAYVFADLNCNSQGDAYDRTGSVFMINPNSGKKSILNALIDSITQLPVFIDNNGSKYQGISLTNDYEPPLELMRFFTPFGVKHFNNLRVINNYPWADEVSYKQDISNQMPQDADEIWIGVFIGNYDKGGHEVSLDLDFYPFWDDDDTTKRIVQPLFSTLNIMEMSGQNYGRLFNNDTLSVDFTLAENIKNPQLIYTSTGHGGWGNGDEFNQTLNEIYVDGKLIYNIIPWRTDCGTYRFYNPASGNFGNGMSSSDLSRSNWCPGTLTPPYFIDLKDINAGKHKMQIVIHQGEDEGNSFSHWNVTGIMIGEQ